MGSSPTGPTGKNECQAQAALVGTKLSPDAFVFSLAPDHSEFLVPDSVSQRYSKAAARLGIDPHLHNQRHYSATELIAAGVDIPTVAGRLGHGGGTTTLRVYTACVSESDQRAAQALFARLPSRPEQRTESEGARVDPRSPYEHVAAAISAAITAGEISPGSPLPPTADLAQKHKVSPGTVRRAIKLLADWGLVDDVRRITQPE